MSGPRNTVEPLDPKALHSRRTDADGVYIEAVGVGPRERLVHDSALGPARNPGKRTPCPGCNRQLRHCRCHRRTR